MREIPYELPPDQLQGNALDEARGILERAGLSVIAQGDHWVILRPKHQPPRNRREARRELKALR